MNLEEPEILSILVCRVPEECPEEVGSVINACRRLDANERPTALEVCSLIESSAPRRSDSAASCLQEGGEHMLPHALPTRCLCSFGGQYPHS